VTRCRTDGSAARIAATSPPRSTRLSPYRYPSTATSTTGSICCQRSVTLRVPNSGAQEENTAPRLAAASSSTKVSGMLGAYAATRSPGPTPSRRSPARTRRTASRSSAAVSVTGSRVWP
jgi:hypothetical protein